MTRVIAVSCLVVASIACGFSEAKEKSETAARRFHQQLNDGQLKDIYLGTTDEFRKGSPETDFTAFAEAVRRKLGTFKSAETTSWNVNTTLGGTFVSLVQRSQYEQDAAEEQFVYLMKSGEPFLQGYNINSKALILK